ncbi:MAG: hypothetical protein GXN95_00935 [Methanococci archaeon]|nr:hypothetical protein [Methanococci archaeon]
MKKFIFFTFLLLISFLVSSIYASEFRIPPDVNVYMPIDNVTLGENGIIELTIHNPIVNDVNLNGELLLRVPSDVTVEGGNIQQGGAGLYQLEFSVKPGDSKTITLYLKFPERGTYIIDGKVLYWPGNSKNNSNEITLHKVVEVLGDHEENNAILNISLTMIITFMGLVIAIIILLYKLLRKNNTKKLEEELKQIGEKINEVHNETERQKLKREKIRILCDLIVAHIKSNNYSNAITALKDLKDLLNSFNNASHNEEIDRLISNLDVAMRKNINLNKEDMDVITKIIDNIKRKYM